MSFPIVLDVFIAILLAITIGYAIILNRKLKTLRAGESEMRSAIERFGIAAAQAEANLARYKDIAAQPDGPSKRDSADAGRALAPLVSEARKLAADLNLLIGRGESLIAEKTATPASTTGAPTTRTGATTTRPSLQTLTRAKPAGPSRAGRVDMANPAATWSLDEELELIDVLKAAR
jgi:hypothetical protein